MTSESWRHIDSEYFRNGNCSAKIERFAQMVRDALSGPDPTFRKAYLRLFLESVTVGEGQIRMRGPTAALAKAATLDELPAASAVVPSSVREWRPVGDSNPCYRRERAVS